MIRRKLPEQLASLSMAEVWRRIEAWLAQHYPDGLARLAPPATDVEIAALEQAIGGTLPPDYVASLRIHAGTNQLRSTLGAPYNETLFADFRPLSPEVVLARRAWLLEGYAEEAHSTSEIVGVRRAVYDGGWLPVVQADEDLAVFYCIDFVPPSPVDAHQIVWMCTNDPDRFAPWSSFSHLLVDQLLLPISNGVSFDEELLAESGIVEFDRD